MSSQKKENNLRLQMEAREKRWKSPKNDNHDGCMSRIHGDEKRQKWNPEFLKDGLGSRSIMIHQGKISGVVPTLALENRDLDAIKDTSVCRGGTADLLISAPEEKETKYRTSVITIDSDEEDVNKKNIEDTFRAWLRKNIKDGIKRARASQHLFNQQILDAVIEPDKQLPDVRMQVPDHNMHKEGTMEMTCESQLAEAHTEEKYIYSRRKKQIDDPPDTKIVRKNQCQIRDNGKVVEGSISEPTTENEMEPGGNAMKEFSPRKNNSSSSMLIFQAGGKDSSTMANEMECKGNAMPESSPRKDNSSSSMLILQADDKESSTKENEMECRRNTMPMSSPRKDDSSSNMLIFQVEDKESSTSSGLEELWKDMYLATEFSKLTDASDESDVMQQNDKCNHSYFLQDDFGFVCRICGIIGKSIETIFDYQWTKGLHSIRTYANTFQCHTESSDKIHLYGIKISQEEFNEAELVIHPRHMKQMKPHQLDGFKFLVKNLVAVAPRGCILAHAPGSGKTFMLVSFIQSFLARYPLKRPLVVLPKGILPIWKNELQRWQVENIPLYDFYSAKADNRIQQLEVLKNWQEKKSILFLGYQQFSTIIFDKECSSNKAAAACQKILLSVPSLLILDEGHTPRNENTNVLDSLARVVTPCKVVLSGTLFQNHVREVFTILNLVCPKFLRSETSRAIVKRILSRMEISGKRISKIPGENTFYDLVEENLRSTNNFKMKVSVIQDLREMTKDVLHYYKGDFLEELPGLVDFTVLLKPSSKQNSLVQELGSFDRFKRLSLGSAIYMHPQLYYIANEASSDRLRLIDSFIEESVDIGDGVKLKFFLNILSLAECVGEKVLVFSQYILPLRFLERLLIKKKGWQLGREIFVITGDSISEHREQSMEQFNNSPDAKVFFGSIKACGEGISLVGASRVVILDVHLNPSVTRQAIGRAFRPGQMRSVYVYRLVAADSQEEEDHKTCSNKELISKMWFEWSGYYVHQDFELDQVDISNSEDKFLESPRLVEDIKALYRRPTVS